MELLCSQRGPGDKWNETVKGRIESAQDLHAADAVYHQQCNINFRTGRNISWTFQSHGSDGENKKGRAEYEDRLTAFFKAISYTKKCESIKDVKSLTLKTHEKKVDENFG